MSTTRKIFIWIVSIIGIAGIVMLVYSLMNNDKNLTYIGGVFVLITFLMTIVRALTSIIPLDKSKKTLPNTSFDININFNLKKEEPEIRYPNSPSINYDIAIEQMKEGNYEKALEAFKIASKQYYDTSNKYSSDVAKTDYNIGLMYIELANYKEAKNHLIAALSWFKQDERKENIRDITLIQYNIAYIYYMECEFDKVITFCEDYITSIETQHTEVYDLLINFKILLAKCYAIKGDFDTPFNIYNSFEASITSTDNYELMSKVYDGVIDFYYDIENYDIAYDKAKKLLDIQLKHFGRKHLYTARTYNSIGSIYWSKNDNKNALRNHEKALEIRELLLNANHPDVLTSKHNIANGYYRLNEYKKSLELHSEILKTRETLLGKKHPDTASSYISVGFLYAIKKRIKESQNMFQLAVEIREDVFGDCNLLTANSYDLISVVFMVKKEYDTALDYLFRSVSIAEKILGELHHNVIEKKCRITMLLLKLGRYSQAYDLINETYRSELNSSRTDYSQQAVIYVLLAGTCSKLEKKEEANEYIQFGIRAYCKYVNKPYFTDNINFKRALNNGIRVIQFFIWSRKL